MKKVHYILKKFFVILLIVAILFTLPIPVAKASSDDAFRMMHINVMAIDDGQQRSNFCQFILGKVDKEDVNQLADKAQKSYLSGMSKDDIITAINMYKELNEDNRGTVRTIIFLGLNKDIPYVDKFTHIKETFNYSIANSSSNDNGIQFLAAIFSKNSNPIAYNDSTDPQKIELKYSADNEGRMSSYLIMLGFSSIVSSYEGSNTFQKLLSYAESVINGADKQEIYYFKKFMYSKNLFSGTPQEPTAQPTQPQNPNTDTTSNPAVTAPSGSTGTNSGSSGNPNTSNPVQPANPTLTLEKAQENLSKINTLSIKSAVSNNKASVQIKKEEIPAINKLLDQIASTTQKANDELAKAGVSDRINSSLILNGAAGNTADSIKLEMVSDIYNSAKVKKIDKIVFNSPVACIDIPTDAVQLDNGNNLALTVSKLNKTNLTKEVMAITGGSNIFQFEMKSNDKTISTFNKPLYISIPYDIKSSEDPEKITVFYLDNNNKLQNMSAKYDPITKSVGFYTNHFSRFFVKLNKVSFKDVNENTYNGRRISVIASKGIISGNGKGIFNPKGAVTRAEFSSMLVKLLALDNQKSNISFTDVPKGQWYYNSVNSAYTAGLIGGIKPDQFAPGKFISRQDAAVIIKNVLEKNYNKSFKELSTEALKEYTDGNKISEYAKTAVAACQKYSIFDVEDGLPFGPQKNLTREEAALVIYNLIDLNRV